MKTAELFVAENGGRQICPERKMDRLMRAGLSPSRITRRCTRKRGRVVCMVEWLRDSHVMATVVLSSSGGGEIFSFFPDDDDVWLRSPFFQLAKNIKRRKRRKWQQNLIKVQHSFNIRVTDKTSAWFWYNYAICYYDLKSFECSTKRDGSRVQSIWDLIIFINIWEQSYIFN